MLFYYFKDKLNKLSIECRWPTDWNIQVFLIVYIIFY